MKYNPHPYQVFAEDHLFTHPAAGLFMGMGLGKTVVTLSAIHQLIYGDMAVRKVLIIAPLKVAETTWTDERDQWNHLRHLTTSQILGPVKDRLEALKAKVDIYLINPENIAWLVTHLQSAWPFDMLVVDESSTFKNPASQRFRALRMVLPKISRMVILTGTPIPNGLADLWSQLYILDRGARLGKTVTEYRNTYLYAEKSDGHIVYKYGCSKENAKTIYNKVGDICISMKSKDYLNLPQRIDKVIHVKLSAELQKRYYDFEETEVLSFLQHEKLNIDGSIAKISAPNAAALMTKLLQFSSGAIYSNPDSKEFTEIHTEKIEALGEIIDVSQGEPILIFYSYQHDLIRLQKAFKVKVYKDRNDLVAWNEGKIPLLAAHPKSLAYGMNMQAGGCIVVWFGMTFDAALWEQGNSRLDRQGQTKPPIIYQLVCPGTADDDAAAVIARKVKGQGALLDAVQARIDKYKNKST